MNDFLEWLIKKFLPKEGTDDDSSVSWINILEIEEWVDSELQKKLPFCKLKIIFKTSRRLSSCFPFKDRLPKSFMSGVIYKYTCAECNLGYIGCSKRFWEKRLEEHLHVSALTGKPLSGLQIFAPMMHVRSDGDCPARKISREDFTIIGREKNNYLLQLKESILITRQRPALNANIASVPLSLMGP